MQTPTKTIQGPQINQFNNIAPQAIPRSMFQRNFTRRSTFNQDYIVPIFIDEILPGDEISLNLNAQIRMSTPIKPIFDNLYFETFYFFVPYRLVWANWEKFQGQQTNPGDSVAYSLPVLNDLQAPISTTGFAVESIYDYFGLPTLVSDIKNITSLYNRGYDLIWNEWFRDENLQNSLTINITDGPDDPSYYQLRKRNKRKDYFTSALPWPQKGDPVSINLGATAPLIFPDRVLKSSAIYKQTDNTLMGNLIGIDGTANDPNIHFMTRGGIAMGGDTAAYIRADLPLDGYADLSAASAITINSLRQAALYQQILELDARGGTRYVESIFSRFGVVSPDFRLQRPELIGQGSSRVNVYAVPQTQSTDSGTTPQGNLAAFGQLGINSGHSARYSATEHGMILGLANVRADLTYQQGVPRMFQRRTRLDFYEPLLNGLGEQAIRNQEIYATGDPSDLATFGYQERFAEYRFKNSEITGKFRSTDPQSLDIWHLAQEFGALPALSSSFITENVPMARVLAVSDEPSFLMDANFEYRHVRPMPIRSNPGITRL